jgi:hypothetical protein
MKSRFAAAGLRVIGRDSLADTAPQSWEHCG